MHSLLTLYNPKYQSDLINAHLNVLKECGEVAFGKVRVKNNDMPHPFKIELETIYNATNNENFTQLFITDYANLYVAKVVKITHDDCAMLAPAYYKDNDLKVESWFIITDMREIYKKDFESVRDYFLANIKMPLRDNHTYALYGNNYVYPLIIEQNQNYFEDEILHYKNIYKTQKYFDTKEILERYCFGKNINLLMSDTIDAIVSAEMEYLENKENPLNDFSAVIMKYSKSVERELYALFKVLFAYLGYNNPGVLNINYEVQGLKYRLKDIFEHKPNLGTYNYLMKKDEIASTFENIVPDDIKKSFSKDILGFMHTLKDLRNENMHGKSATLSEASELRDLMLGIGKDSILMICIKVKSALNFLCKESYNG